MADLPGWQGLGPGQGTWPCMVCGDERPDEQISVAHRQMPGLEDMFPEARVNVRYCNDRGECVREACASGPWPLGRPRRVDV